MQRIPVAAVGQPIFHLPPGHSLFSVLLRTAWNNRMLLPGRSEIPKGSALLAEAVEGIVVVVVVGAGARGLRRHPKLLLLLRWRTRLLLGLVPTRHGSLRRRIGRWRCHAKKVSGGRRRRRHVTWTTTATTATVHGSTHVQQRILHPR